MLYLNILGYISLIFTETVHYLILTRGNDKTYEKNLQ